MDEHRRILAQARPPALSQLERLRSHFKQYLQEARAVCAESWARFHPVRMVAGCALLASSCLLCYVASSVASALNFSYRHFLFYPVLWGLAGATLLGLAHHLHAWAALDSVVLASWGAAASQLAFFWHCWARRTRGFHATSVRALSRSASARQKLWVWMTPALPLGILLVRCSAMLSDSFVVAEAQVAPFLLISSVLLLLLRLQWEGRLESGQLLGLVGLLLACVRLSGLFRQCREETPSCHSSPLLAPLASLQDPQAKNFYYILCLAVLASLAWGVRSWLCHYGNLNRPSALVLFVRWGFPLLAACISSYWAFTSSAEEALMKLHAWMPLALVAFPRAVFGLVAAGLLLVLWDPVTVFARDSRDSVVTGVPIVPPSSQAELLHVIPQLYRRMQESLKSQLHPGARAGDRATVAAYGLGSVYSAALLISLALLGFLLLTLHSERLSLAFLLLFVEAAVLLWIHACAVASTPQAGESRAAWGASPHT